MGGNCNEATMKTSTFFIAATIATASAFAPATKAPQNTQLGASIFKTISNLDLWEPVKDSNNYGARARKTLKTGSLTEKSYVPTGLTKAQYAKIRSDAVSKKAANYQKNVAKAGKFIDFTDWYAQRGTQESGSWLKAPNLGHTMAKTKYDWSGEDTSATPLWSGINASTKTTPKKAAPKKKAGGFPWL